jgi:hypothetical protein
MLSLWKHLHVGVLVTGCVCGWFDDEGFQRAAMANSGLESSPPNDNPEKSYPNASDRVGAPNLGQQFVRGALPCFGVWLRRRVEMNLRDANPPLVQGMREVCRASPREFACRHRSAYGSYTNIAKTYQCLKACAQGNVCPYRNLKFENVRGGARSALEVSFSFDGVRIKCSFVDQSWPVNMDIYGDGLQTRHRIWSSRFNCGR